MNVREVLESLLSGEYLDRATSAVFMDAILAGDVAPAQIAAALGALRTRDETAPEMLGFLDSLLRHAHRVESSHDVLVDTCGTGGDGLHLFNLSTATALVASACGVAVAKHGNRSVSSACGSTDLLEASGVRLHPEPDRLAEALDRFGLVFLHAPFHHPALGKVAALRRELGVMTTFNLLGPLANPAPITHQVVGVPRRRILSTYTSVFAARAFPACVVHGHAGADEALPGGPFHLHRVARDGSHTAEVIDPAEWGVPDAALADLRGGDAAHNAALLQALLDGEGRSALRAAVALNTALVLLLVERERDPREAVRVALRAIDSGDARRLFDTYAAWSRA